MGRCGEVAEAPSARVVGEGHFGRNIRASSQPWENLALGTCVRFWRRRWLGRMGKMLSTAGRSTGRGPEKGGWRLEKRSKRMQGAGKACSAITARVSEAPHRLRCTFRTKAFEKSQRSRRGAFLPYPTQPPLTPSHWIRFTPGGIFSLLSRAQ